MNKIKLYFYKLKAKDINSQYNYYAVGNKYLNIRTDGLRGRFNVRNDVLLERFNLIKNITSVFENHNELYKNFENIEILEEIDLNIESVYQFVPLADLHERLLELMPEEFI